VLEQRDRIAWKAAPEGVEQALEAQLLGDLAREVGDHVGEVRERDRAHRACSGAVSAGRSRRSRVVIRTASWSRRQRSGRCRRDNLGDERRADQGDAAWRGSWKEAWRTRPRSPRSMHRRPLLPLLAAALLLAPPAGAKVVEVTITVKELDLVVDHAGTKQPMWTFGGTIPGPLVRVTEGDLVKFTLVNDPANKQSHSMDFHAARADVLDEFAPIKPGETKKFDFKAEYPGVFIYHCGADSMAEHIARGMYGVIIVDPKEGYSKDFPKPDREYVLVQSDLFETGTSPHDIMEGKGWKAALINGKKFHYDPVHDPNASLALEAKPGERTRIYFVNAMVN